MDAISFIAERKIEEAIACGEFDDLPGAGKPLELEDTSHMAPDMRMAYTILKNSGYLERSLPEGRPAAMRDLMRDAPEEGLVYGKIRRLKFMLARIKRTQEALAPERTAGKGLNLEESPYIGRLIDRA